MHSGGYLNFNGSINVAKTEKQLQDLKSNNEPEITDIASLRQVRNQRYNIHPMVKKEDCTPEKLSGNTAERYLDSTSWKIEVDQDLNLTKGTEAEVNQIRDAICDGIMKQGKYVQEEIMTLKKFEHCSAVNFNRGDLPPEHLAEYEMSSFIGHMHGACNQSKSSEAIVAFLKAANYKNFPKTFMMAITSNSYTFTNLLHLSNQIGKKNHNLEPAVKFLSQLIITCSVRAPNQYSEMRLYTFNGVNLPKFVWASCLLNGEFLDQYENGNPDAGAIFNVPGILSGNLLIEDAMRYCRTEFVHKELLNEGKPNECQKQDDQGKLITQETLIRCMFKIYLKDKNEKHGINTSCMLLDNKLIHMNPQEGQVLFFQPTFVLQRKIHRSRTYNICDDDSSNYQFEVDLVPSESQSQIYKKYLGKN